jgi:hypothetical protein
MKISVQYNTFRDDFICFMFGIRKYIFYILIFLALPTCINAAGHGPLFGLTTPTNYKNGWSLDIGVLNRRGAVATETLMRAMIGYGITAKWSVFFSAPYFYQTAEMIPQRQSGAMPGSSDYESTVAWRFQQKNLERGSRYESTLFGGAVFPGPQQPHDYYEDHNENPGFWLGAATGKISRRYYMWGGVTFTRYLSSENGDRRPDEIFYSLVFGVRPFEKMDYPSWDWRVFAEFTGEHAEQTEHHGFTDTESGGDQMFFGPTIVGLFKSYAIQGGIQFPVYRDVGERYEKELARFGFNVSYIW